MNKQNKIIVGVVALILALTVGYAVFSQSLNINGTAKASANFGLIFEKSTNKPTCRGYSGGDDCQIDDVAEIIESGKTLKITIDNLMYPTAYVKIPVLIKNIGTVDAVLKSMQVEGLESNDINVKYSITEQDIKDGYVVKPGDDNRKEVEVEVTWDKDSKNSEPIEVNFTITMNFEQASNVAVTTSSSSIAANCTQFTKKDTYEIGDVISFCNNDAEYTDSNGDTVKGKSEDFYVIEDNGETVTALAKYNLMVGSGATDDFAKAFSGLQSNETTTYPVAFANKDENNKSGSNYLGYWTNNTSKPLEEYGTSYPADVYGENSALYEYVQKYKEYFTSTLNKKTTDMRLITYDEMVSLGCDASSRTCKADTTSTNKREWLHSTFYWSAVAKNYSFVLSVYDTGYLGGINFWTDGIIGVRPVIIINKSEI